MLLVIWNEWTLAQIPRFDEGTLVELPSVASKLQG